ncbi:MAG: hypothetical protein ACK559_06220, partial [bacterium]
GRPAGCLPRLDRDLPRWPHGRRCLVATRHRSVGGAGEHLRIVVEHEQPQFVHAARHAEIDLDGGRAVGRLRTRPAVGRRPQVPGLAVGEQAGRTALGDRTHREPGIV